MCTYSVLVLKQFSTVVCKPFFLSCTVFFWIWTTRRCARPRFTVPVGSAAVSHLTFHSHPFLHSPQLQGSWPLPCATCCWKWGVPPFFDTPVTRRPSRVPTLSTKLGILPSFRRAPLQDVIFFALRFNCLGCARARGTYAQHLQGITQTHTQHAPSAKLQLSIYRAKMGDTIKASSAYQSRSHRFCSSSSFQHSGRKAGKTPEEILLSCPPGTNG